MGVDIYPMKPARTSGATTKPLNHAHKFEVASSWQDKTFMYCAHCGESYSFFPTAVGASWVRMDFIMESGKLENPPGACALPEATQ